MKKQQLGAALIWCIWNRQNDKIFNEKEVSPGIILERARNCNKSKDRNSWQAPPSNCGKINCDASLCDQGWIGLGVVAQDSNGDVFFAGTRRI